MSANGPTRLKRTARSLVSRGGEPARPPPPVARVPIDEPKTADRASPAERAQSTRGLLARLIEGLQEARFERLHIRVAAFSGSEAEVADSRHVVKALGHHLGVRVRPLQQALALRGPWEDGVAVARAEQVGRRWLEDCGADLLVWGEVPSPGTTVFLRFVSAVPALKEQLGAFGAASVLALPADFGPEFADVLFGSAMAAIVPRTHKKLRLQRHHLMRSVYAARPLMSALPTSLTTAERGTIRACFADAAVQAWQISQAPAVREVALQCYEAALKSLTAPEMALTRAFVQRNVGLALTTRAGDAQAETLAAAVDAFDRALEVLPRASFPFEWATAQNRLGEARFRLEAEHGDPELLKQAVAAHQAALQVFTRTHSPIEWAATKHSLAQVAQLLGEQLRSADVLEKAVEAVRAALSVRSRDQTPQLWAATQNDLGTALFLLGRLIEDDALLTEAVAAFAEAREVYAGLDAEAVVALIDKNMERVERLRGRLVKRPKPRLDRERSTGVAATATPQSGDRGPMPEGPGRDPTSPSAEATALRAAPDADRGSPALPHRRDSPSIRHRRNDK